ncbi:MULTISPECIES: hypothetical protein [unclassified Roseateles]|uniref:hypothetical protein n=1 Tax=unclassified Roseateles TaxID=2626991 RepID=UPI0007004281|nr:MULTISPECIES: hypothetical protein [unclassified Roseateles]KQW42184.1 hypothetical protein ASC81_20125 [Pelomonas sp. Root405]KRA68057.1 hypothetical protein ASD88_21705 [Pelomonas sp. Root662]
MTARFNVLSLLVAGLLGMSASAEELPRSPACRAALQALDQAEEAIAAAAAASAATTLDRERQRSVASRLQPLRQRVADACLGGLTTSPSPSQRSWTMPAPPARPSAALPRTPAVPLPLPPVHIPRPQAPVTVSNCNGATCIASDGSTLTRVGPNVVGPRGLCTVQGMFLHCP